MSEEEKIENQNEESEKPKDESLSAGDANMKPVSTGDSQQSTEENSLNARTINSE